MLTVCTLCVGSVLGQLWKTVPVLDRCRLDQYRMWFTGLTLGRYRQISTDPVSAKDWNFTGQYWKTVLVLDWYRSYAGSILDVMYWSDTMPVQTKQCWPSIDLVLDLYFDQYRSCAGPLPDAMYSSISGPVQTNRLCPSKGPVPGNENAVCKMYHVITGLQYWTITANSIGPVLGQ